MQGSITLDSWMGTDHGICPWDITLVMGIFDGWTFWVGCGWFFFGSLGKDGDGEEKTTGHVYQGRFSLDNVSRCFQTSTFFLCYILYIERWGFLCTCFKTLGNVVPDPRCPGQTRVWLKFRQPDDLFHTLKTMWGLFHLVPPRTPRNSWYGVLCTCGLCYMLFLLYVI